MKWFNTFPLYLVGPDNTCNAMSSLGCQKSWWNVTNQRRLNKPVMRALLTRNHRYFTWRMEDFEVTWSWSLYIKKSPRDYCYSRRKMKDQWGKVTVNHLSLHMRENACAAHIVKIKTACPHQRAEGFRKELGRNVTEIIKALDCPSLASFGPCNSVTFIVVYEDEGSMRGLPTCGTLVGNFTGNVSTWNPVVQMSFFPCV